MGYFDFNNRVFEFYIQRAKTSFCSFSLDQSEFERLVDPTQIASFEILKGNWTFFVKQTSDIPLYFGLIAVQCFAATLMEDGDQVTEDAYQFRLQKLLGLDINLQMFFKSPIGTETIQEKIWYDAKFYLENRLGLKLEIPNRRSHKGKYVQYPLSQLLLKTEDLKDFTIFYSEHFLPGENIPFYFFREKLLEWFPEKISVRAEKLMHNPVSRDRCCEQLFNHYQSWSGEVFQKIRQGTQTIKSTYIAKEHQGEDLILIIEEEQYYFYFKKNLIAPDNIFNIEACHYFNRGLILFNPIPDCDNEFKQSRFLYLNKEIYFLVDRRFKAREYDFLQKHASATIPITPQKALFKYALLSFKRSHPLQEYYYSVNPVLLQGGIKLNRSNQFLSGFGPIIDYQEEFTVIFNNRPISYHPNTALPGDYKIRVTQYHDVCFSIIEVKPYKKIDTLSKGWDFQTLNLTDQPHIEGCKIYPMNSVEKNAFRAWIDANLGIPVNKTNQPKNLILKTLEYAKRKSFKC
jgi:hypothetical protein